MADGENTKLQEVLDTIAPTQFLNQQWTITTGFANNPSKYAYVQLKPNDSEQYRVLVRCDHVAKIDKGNNPFRYMVLGQTAHGDPLLAVLSSLYLETSHVGVPKPYDKNPLPNFIKSLKAVKKTDPDWNAQAFDIICDYAKGSNRLLQTLKAIDTQIEEHERAQQPVPPPAIDLEDSDDERQKNKKRLNQSSSSELANPEKRQTKMISPVEHCSGDSGSKSAGGGQRRGRGRGRGQGRGRASGPPQRVPMPLNKVNVPQGLLPGEKRKRNEHPENVDEEGLEDADEAAKTPAEEFPEITKEGKRERIEKIVRDYCPFGLETIVVDIDRVIPPYRGPDEKLLPRHQIRLVSPSFLKGLTKKFKDDYNSISAVPSILLVSPDQCQRKDDFHYDDKETYSYFALGGNHSLCARADIAALQPNRADMRDVKATILVGLPLADQRFLAWSDNVDGEYRNKMSHIHRIIYIHNRWIEMNKPEKNFAFKKLMAEEVHFDNMGGGEKSDARALNTHDNHFQLAFREGRVWNQVLRVFQAWERGKIKDQKFETPQIRKRGKNEEPVDNADRGVIDMKLTHWVSMQGVKNDDSICNTLGKVIAGEYSLAQMDKQFDLWKWNDKIRKAFCLELDLPTFKRCQEEFPELNDEKKWSFEYEFEKQAELIKKSRRENAEGGKKKPRKGSSQQVVLEYERELFPAIFINYCTFLKNRKAQAKARGVEGSDNAQFHFEHRHFGSLYYEVFCGDARALQQVEGIKARPYTLMIADIPYGYNLSSANHDDSVMWGRTEILQMIQSFKLLTTAPFYRIILIHSQRQTPSVLEVLSEECNCGLPMDGVWYKPNAFNEGGARLCHQTEYFYVGFGSSDPNRGKSFEFFNFAHNEPRGNHVTAKTVTKYKSPLTGSVVNGYQKPRKLYNYFVCHYSRPRDWVLDLCAGSGTGALCALGCGRNATAVEIDPRQASQIPARLHTVGQDYDGTLEDPSAADVAKELSANYAAPKAVELDYVFDEEDDQVDTAVKITGGGPSGEVGGETFKESANHGSGQILAKSGGASRESGGGGIVGGGSGVVIGGGCGDQAVDKPSLDSVDLEKTSGAGDDGIELLVDRVGGDITLVDPLKNPTADDVDESLNFISDLGHRLFDDGSETPNLEKLS